MITPASVLLLLLCSVHHPDEGGASLSAQIEARRGIVFAVVEVHGTPLELALDVALPIDKTAKLRPAVIYIHGGGYSQGTRKDGWRQARAMAASGYVGVTIDYRLMQQGPFPASLHDCKSAIRYLRDNSESFGIDPERIAVWGHSAGGHLSALIGTTGNVPEMEGEVGITEGSSAVSCVVDLSGPTDILLLMTGRPSSNAGANENAQQRSLREKTKAASPMTYADEYDPPFLIIHGVDDTAIPIEHSELLDASLRDAGAPVEFMRVPACDHNIEPPAAWERIGTFLDEHLGGNAAEILRSGLPD